MKLIFKTKNIFIIVIVSIFIFPYLLYITNFCYSIGLSPELIKEQQNQNTNFQKGSGYQIGSNIGNIIATIIQAFLGLLGMIFLILIVVAGYNWMTAGGNEEKITKAKDTLWRAIIGLIIIVGAYAISYFVFSNLPWGGGPLGGS